jgi:hypothetical protein
VRRVVWRAGQGPLCAWPTGAALAVFQDFERQSNLFGCSRPVVHGGAHRVAVAFEELEETTVRDLSSVDPLTVMAEPALLSLARTALRSHTAPVVEGGQAIARLAIWRPVGRSQDERPLTVGCPCGEISHAGPGDGR